MTTLNAFSALANGAPDTIACLAGGPAARAGRPEVLRLVDDAVPVGARRGPRSRSPASTPASLCEAAGGRDLLQLSRLLAQPGGH